MLHLLALQFHGWYRDRSISYHLIKGRNLSMKQPLKPYNIYICQRLKYTFALSRSPGILTAAIGISLGSSNVWEGRLANV